MAAAPSRWNVARVLGWLTAAPGWRELLVALVLAAPVPLLMLASPNVAVTFTYHDIFIPLDAAWRTLQGQWPHLDFYTPLGLSYYWMHGAAAWLWGMDGRVVIWANFLVLPFVLGPGIVLAWRRLDAFAAILLVALITELIVSPAFIDGPSNLVAHVANYNRVGWALCSLICLWSLSAPRRASLGGAVFEAAAIGVFLLFLLYLKVTLFALAGATIAVGCVTTRGVLRGSLLAGLIVLAGVGALEALRPGLLLAYVADLRRTAAVGSGLVRDLKGLFSADARDLAAVALLAVAALVLAPGRRLATLGCVAVAAGCALVATQNFGNFAPPLTVIVMILAQRVGAVSAPGTPSRAAWVTGGTLLVAMSALPFLAVQANGAVDHLEFARMQAPDIGGGRSASLRTVRWHQHWIENWYYPGDFTIEEARKWNVPPPVWLLENILNDGYDLVNSLGLSHPRIGTLSFSNPFPVALGDPAPRGVAAWWDPGRTFRKQTLTADQAIGDADIVMVPKYWRFYPIVEALEAVARPKLDAEFTPHESHYWTAWVRKPIQ